MKDIQCVFIREIAKLTGVNFAEVLRLEATGEDYSLVAGVLVNGTSTRYIKRDTRAIFVVLPEGMQASDAHVVTLQRVRALGDTSFDTAEDVPVATNLADISGRNANRVVLDAGVLRVVGTGFLKAVQVLVNKQNQPFVILDERTLISTLPASDASIDSIDVILSSRNLSGQSFFNYMLSPTLSEVEGPYKLMQQVVKVLLTTPGSDAFSKEVGAGLQRVVATNVDPRNTQAFLAKLVSSVMSAGVRMQAAQMFSSIPSSERLGALEVVNVGFDNTDPTAVDLTLKLTSVDGRQAVFGMLMNTVTETVTAFAGV